MIAVTATEFAKNFRLYNEAAQRAPVAITSYGSISGYFVSAREYEELRRLREFERHVYRLDSVPKAVVEAVRKARMGSCHEHLNALLDDK